MHLLSRYGQVCSLHEVDAVEVDAADAGGAAALGFAKVSTEAGGVSFFAATAGLAATVGVAAVTAAAALRPVPLQSCAELRPSVRLARVQRLDHCGASLQSQ